MPNIIRVRIVGVNHSGETNNVLHFRDTVDAFDAPSVLARLQLIAAAVKECVVDTLLPALPSDWAFRKVSAKTVAGFVSDEYESFGEAANVGALGASDVGFASQLISIRTGTGGRRKRGRIFCPPPPEAGVEQSSLTPAQGLLLAAFAACLATKFIDPAATTDFRIGVFSRVTQTASTVYNAAAFTDATQLVTRGNVAVMRSRKLGVGS